MAVQIPSIQRIAPQAPTSVGRIQTQLPDGTKAFAQTSGQLAQAGAQVLKQVDKAEKRTIDMDSIKMNNEYKLAARKLLVDAKTKKGDPRPIYENFDKEMRKLGNEMLSYKAKSGASSRAMAEFEKSIRNADNSIQLERYTQSGHQIDSYHQRIIDSGVKDESVEAIKAAGYVQPGKMDTLAPLNAGLNTMRDYRLVRAVGRGSTVEVPEDYKPNREKGELVLDLNGKKVLVDNVTKDTIAKEGSHTVYETLNVLLSTGKKHDYDKAIYVKENFGKRLDSVNLAKINKQFKKAKDDNNAVEMLSSLRGLTPDQITQKLAKVEKKDAQLAFDVRRLRTADNGRVETERKKYSTKVYDRLAGEILNRKASGNPVLSIVELEAMPDFKKSIPGVTTASEKKSLYQMVLAPKKSDPKVVDDMYRKLYAGKFLGTDPAVLSKWMVGLNDRHRNLFQGYAKAVNMPEGDTAQFSRMRVMGTRVVSLAMERGVIPTVNNDGVTPTAEGTKIANRLRARIDREAYKTNKYTSAKDDMVIVQGAVAQEALHQEDVAMPWYNRLRTKLPAVLFGIEKKTSDRPALKDLGTLKKEEAVKKKEIKSFESMSKNEKAAAFAEFKKLGKPGGSFGKWLKTRGK